MQWSIYPMGKDGPCGGPVLQTPAIAESSRRLEVVKTSVRDDRKITASLYDPDGSELTCDDRHSTRVHRQMSPAAFMEVQHRLEPFPI